MNQLESLTAFITENLPSDAMQFFMSSQEDAQLIRSQKALGNDQIRMGVMTYTGVIAWDNFPFRKYSPGLVYALVMAWLEEHADPLREEFRPEDVNVDPQFNDEDSCLLDITVGLADPLIIQVQEDGPVPYRGKRWTLVNPEIWTAETMDLFVSRSRE